MATILGMGNHSSSRSLSKGVESSSNSTPTSDTPVASA